MCIIYYRMIFKVQTNKIYFNSIARLHFQLQKLVNHTVDKY